MYLQLSNKLNKSLSLLVSFTVHSEACVTAVGLCVAEYTLFRVALLCSLTG